MAPEGQEGWQQRERGNRALFRTAPGGGGSQKQWCKVLNHAALARRFHDIGELLAFQPGKRGLKRRKGGGSGYWSRRKEKGGGPVGQLARCPGKGTTDFDRLISLADACRNGCKGGRSLISVGVRGGEGGRPSCCRGESNGMSEYLITVPFDNEGGFSDRQDT